MKEKTIIVAVGAIIKDSQGRFLLVRHKPEREGYWKGKWICPGGKLKLGEDIHFRFLVESSTYEGNVMLLENYRVKGPDGKVLLDVDEKNTYHFDVASRERMEQIYFKDHLVSEEGDASGVYTFELIVENPLLNKSIIL